ncbi:MAG: hypothetical protein E4H20_06085 [Spirochaetales bacterium]|nr:MAG: hypothetical protein E4H20_06085 [Spirochaetales bacterium]
MSTIVPLELPFLVRGYDCGYGGPLRPLALANMLQEAAGEHAFQLGVGADAMAARGLTWMLSRLDIRVDREPRESERLVVRTWPAGFEKLFAVRDFEVVGEGSDKPIIRASYAYLVVDVEARRPLRPQNAVDPDLASPRPRAMPDAIFTVPRSEAPFVEAYREIAGERHIDHNGHVNNAHLIAWICDASPASERANGHLAALRMEFSQEALLGDELCTVWAPLPASETGTRQACELRRGTDACARAEVTWS